MIRVNHQCLLPSIGENDMELVMIAKVVRETLANMPNVSGDEMLNILNENGAELKNKTAMSQVMSKIRKLCRETLENRLEKAKKEGKVEDAAKIEEKIKTEYWLTYCPELKRGRNGMGSNVSDLVESFLEGI